MGIKWKKSEKQMLYKRLAQERVPLGEVAIPGRTSDGIRRQALKMGLILRRKNPALTHEQEEKLRLLRQFGFSARQIVENGLLEQSLCRTANGIQKILGKLGIVSQKRSLAAKAKKIWQNGEKAEFDAFLVQHSATLATEQIAEKFGVKKSTVANRRRFLGIKRSFAQAMAIPYTKEKMQRVYRQKSQQMFLAFGDRLAERENQLLALAEKIRQNGLAQERLCQKCGKKWPRHRKFFYHTGGKVPAGPNWRPLNVCVICVAKRRHQKSAEKRQQKRSRRAE